MFALLMANWLFCINKFDVIWFDYAYFTISIMDAAVSCGETGHFAVNSCNVY